MCTLHSVGTGTTSRRQEQHAGGGECMPRLGVFKEAERTSVWLSLSYFLEVEVEDTATWVGS